MAACRNGHPVPGDAAFCGACGDDLRPRCRHGHPNRPGAFACLTCGARVLAGADAPSGGGPPEPAADQLADGYMPPDYPSASHPVRDGRSADYQSADYQSADYQSADYQSADYQSADYPPPGYPAAQTSYSMSPPGASAPTLGAEAQVRGA
ncbi:MAG: hypothetical protein ACYCVZ_18825, partial [Streptosporangiaceae bacterium]